jgi:hypothetical protein
MKNKRLINAILPVVAALLALSPSTSHAQPTNIAIEPVGATVMTDAFGNQSSSTGGGAVWQNWYINGAITNFAMIFDTTNPPPTGSVGSMYLTQGWDGTNAASGSTYACIDGNFWGGATFNAAQYSSIELDFKYDTINSTITPVTEGNVEIGVGDDNRATSDGKLLFNLQNSGATAANFDGAWHHISIPIPSDIGGATFSKGITWKIFNPATVSGNFNFWFANLTLVARTNAPPPPTITINKASPGLRQFADATPDYNRQTLRTDTNLAGIKNIDWVGHPGAAYSWTVSDFAAPNHAGYNLALTITPDPAESIVYSDPDWSSTNALWIQISANANGTVGAGIAFKTNLPSNNSQYYSAPGQLTGGNTLQAPTAVGTWTLSFPSDTSITLTAPNGASTNVSLPADVAAMFTNVSFSLYSTMGGNGNIGQYATLTSFKVTGVADPVNEDLTDGALNTPFLVLMSQGYGSNPNPPNQIFVTTNDSYWLHWTLPDNGFGLVAKTALTDPYWLDYAPGTILLNGSSRWVKVPTASLPSPNTSFFAVVKRPFTQLQVLLPGETAAPNTPSGKTGTPTSFSLSNPGLWDPIIVRAVDPTWNLINVTDTIHLTTTDTTATVPATDVAMVNGVATFTVANNTSITFGTTGTYTVTATNMSQVMPAATSAPVTVIP